MYVIALNEIQPGLFTNLLGSVWAVVAKMVLKQDERKLCVLAMAKLMAHDQVRQNPQLLGVCCSGLVNLLGLVPTTQAAIAEDESEDEVQLANGGAGLDFEVAFSKLKNTDLPGATAGLAPDIPDLASAAKALLRPLQPVIMQLAQANIELQPLALFVQ